MQKNAAIPYAIIAAIGILLVIVVSVVGLNQQDTVQEDKGEEQAEEQKDGGGSSGEGEKAEDSSAGETEVDGEQVFQQNCASCHGSDLSGQAGPALDTVGSKYSKDEIKDIIAEGFPPNMPAGLVEGKNRDAVAQWLSEQK